MLRSSSWFRLAANSTAVVFLVSCTSTKELRPQQLVPEFGPGFSEITSFTTVDGKKHPFEGGGRVVGDELELHWRGAEGSSVSSDPDSFASILRIPLRQISVVEVRYQDSAKTAVVTVLAIVLAGGVIIGVALLAKGFCPFLYSYDGQTYVLDGELYGGAVTPSLARTDWAELEHLREVDGRYRLLLANEVDETQHTDSLALLVVDHSPDEHPVMGQDGRVHLLRGQAPLSARDESGHDLLPFVREVDGVSWTPELLSVSDHLPLADVRNHFTLEFRRAPGATHAWLVANVAIGTWGAAQIRTFLGMRGTQAPQWSTSAEASQELQALSEREELFELGVEVQVGTHWERRALLRGSGPFHSETRAVSLDLTGVQGDTVRLRIHPPISFWRIEALQLSWEERTVTPRVLTARRASDDRGGDVRAILEADDGRTLDQPETGSVARLEFDAPPVVQGRARTVFARAHGWYEVHLHDLEAPETGNLERLAFEPGYAVRRAMDDFVSFRKTGRVPFTRLADPRTTLGAR